MGLLDDAIREHLEFRRQHGADPNEVARQEHEALGPVDRGGNTASASPDGPANATVEAGKELAASTEDSLPPSGQTLPQTGEETAELDMRTVLTTESPVGAAAPAAEESLEWEVPGDSSDGKKAEDQEEPVDDVLEETPDFLRDTPDQDRLWFEQQPPRDFDFDK
ncbi:MAG TPA: hypothetical protein VGY76_01650 [Solirubrobacteraceae bacterium]|jgi:hypothetical protein|nr:hypothetical protein [Solirubrobacteraceae bacterium]